MTDTPTCCGEPMDRQQASPADPECGITRACRAGWYCMTCDGFVEDAGPDDEVHADDRADFGAVHEGMAG